MAKNILDNAEADLFAWASDFREGKVRRPLLAPHPEADERWGTKISRAGLVPLAAYELEDPGLIIGAGDEHGQAVVTSKRAISCSGSRVHQSWEFSDLYDARALDDLTGVVLLPYEPNPDYDDRFDTLLAAHEPSSGYEAFMHREHPREKSIDWLKFEAAFADAGGRLDGWLAELGPRLARTATFL
jgi:hypothetical protein